MDIVIEKTGDLYHRYPNETRPQPCYVQLDPRLRRVAARVDQIIGSGVPADVWNNLVIRWRAPCLKAEVMDQVLAGLETQFGEVIEGWAQEWDGQNHVGRLTDHGREAAEEIEQELERAGDNEADVVQVWEAVDWFGGLGNRNTQRHELGITPTTTADALAALVAREAQLADNEGARVEGVAKYLETLRNEALDALVDEVDQHSTYVHEPTTLRATVARLLAAGANADAGDLAVAVDAELDAADATA